MTAILQAKAKLKSTAILQQAENANKRKAELNNAELRTIEAKSMRDVFFNN